MINIMIGDTIVTDDREIGIVENRSGNSLTVRFPDYGNRRDQVHRSQTKPLAKLILEARAEDMLPFTSHGKSSGRAERKAAIRSSAQL